MVLFMELTLEMAVEAFADWRNNKKSKAEAIPELLTKMVKDLHPIYGTTKLRQTLGINRYQLKRLGIIDLKKIKPITPKSDNSKNKFAVAHLNSQELNGELVLKKGNNSLSLKLPLQHLDSYLQTMAALL